MFRALCGGFLGFLTGLLAAWLILSRRLEEKAAVRPIAVPHPTPAEAPAVTVEKAEAEITGYCMKCRAQRTMQDAQRVMLKNGRPAMKGTCPVCGTAIFRFVKQ